MNTPTDPRGGWTSASNAHPDNLCPGRHWAQRGLPEIASEDADAGTRMHAALAGDAANVTALSGEELDLVDQVSQERFRMIQEWLRGRQLEEIIVEERMWITDPETGLKHSGQPDYVVYATDGVALHAIIFDYKFGRIAVEDPAENAQLRDLVVLADARVGGNLVSATVQIIQPFAGQFTPTVYDGPAISRASEELLARILRSNDPTSPRVAGEAQCKYCRARARCPEFEAWATAPLPKPLTKTAVAEVIEQADTLLPAVSNEKLAAMLNVLGLAEKWFGLLRTEGRNRLRENPQALPGWELRPGTERNTITNIQLVWQRWETAYPGCVKEFIAALKAGKGDLEKAVRTVTGFKGKAVKEALDGLIAGACTTTVTSPRLMRVGEEDAE